MELFERGFVEMKLKPGAVYRENRLVPIATRTKMSDKEKMIFGDMKRHTIRTEDLVCVLVLPDESEGVFLDKAGTEYLISKDELKDAITYRNVAFKKKIAPRYSYRRTDTSEFDDVINDFMLRSDLKRRYRGWEAMGGSIIGEDVVYESYAWLTVGSQYISKDKTFKFEVIAKSKLGWLIKDLKTGKQYDVEESDLALFNPVEMAIKESKGIEEGSIITFNGKRVVVESIDESHTYIVDKDSVRYRILNETIVNESTVYPPKYSGYNICYRKEGSCYVAYRDGEEITRDDSVDALFREIDQMIKRKEIRESKNESRINESRVDNELAKLANIHLDYSRVQRYLSNPKLSKKIENSIAYAKEQFLKDLKGHALEYPVEFLPDYVLDLMHRGDKFKVYVTINKNESPENEKLLLNSDFYVSRGSLLVKQYQKERKSKKSEYSGSYYD